MYISILNYCLLCCFVQSKYYPLVKIFINEKTVEIVGLEASVDKSKYDVCIASEEEIISKVLIGNVLIVEANAKHIQRLLKLLEIKKLKKLLSITLSAKNAEFLQEYFKDEFKIIKASGGVVMKEDKILMIYRLGKWDLPKGKLKKGEDSIKGAKREVEEECSVNILVKDKICSTWHTYIRKDRKILKKTDWYNMDCISDANMRPQIEENIEEVRWMTKEEVMIALNNSYKSIERVFEKFYEVRVV